MLPTMPMEVIANRSASIFGGGNVFARMSVPVPCTGARRRGNKDFNRRRE